MPQMVGLLAWVLSTCYTIYNCFAFTLSGHSENEIKNRNLH